MPSPKRESGSKIAYTRWEPLEASTEDLEASTNTTTTNNNNNVVPFHHFEEEDRTASEQSTTSKLRLSPRTLIINGSQRPLSRSSSRHHVKCWEWSVRILGILIGTSWYYTSDVSIVMWRIMKFFQFLFTVAGLSWILGFMTRWGVHHYYIDSRGHCVTPVPYQYDHETAILIMEEISVKNIQRFFDEFSSVESHQIGSVESYNYAKNISGIYYAFCVF